MSLLDNKPLLIKIIAALVILKFAIMPIIEWQNEQAQSVAKLQKQLDKGLSLVSKHELLITETAKSKQNLNKELDKVAINSDTPLSYQLSIQKKLEQLLNKHELTARSVSWLTPFSSHSFEEHKLELMLAGELKNFTQFIIEVESIQPKISLFEMRTNVSRMFPKQNKLGRFTGKLVLVSWRNVTGDANNE